jgi:hypothetical protein
MKYLLIVLTFSISFSSIAQTPRLGQDPDPVAGDNSRCCRTGKCGDNMKLCADTQIDAERAPKDVYASQKRKNGKSKASQQ